MLIGVLAICTGVGGLTGFGMMPVRGRGCANTPISNCERSGAPGQYRGLSTSVEMTGLGGVEENEQRQKQTQTQKPIQGSLHFGRDDGVGVGWRRTSNGKSKRKRKSQYRGLSTAVEMTGLGGVEENEQRQRQKQKQTQKPIQGSLHCASQRQKRDASVEMTRIGGGVSCFVL